MTNFLLFSQLLVKFPQQNQTKTAIKEDYKRVTEIAKTQKKSVTFGYKNQSLLKINRQTRVRLDYVTFLNRILKLNF